MGTATPTLHQRDYDRRTVQPRHRDLIPALLEGYFAVDAPLDAERLRRLAGDVDRAISNASKTLRFGLVVMLDVIQYAPPLILGRLSTFDALSLEDRQRFLTRLDRSRLVPLTLIFVAWKTLLTMIYFEEPDQLAALGYPGPERRRYLAASASPP